ncbi:LamB/YcsF family protein [Paenibacillus chartarius]|uniref:5-oxoprolinase subunit A n=1 Tax=Paenibacillus chartarius TaxID=747481 RepID=A0ABV6DMS2_9BACL
MDSAMPQQAQIDLNADMGESFGAYTIGDDEALLDIVTSANLACGFHAGDPATMRRAVQRCLAKGVAIGAHPGLPDLAGFGRRTMQITPDDAYELTIYQLGALQAFVKAEGGSLRHVKPHGALYNMAAARPELAEAIARAVARVSPELTLVGLAGSALPRAAEAVGLRAADEAFADRAYAADGSLAPRHMPGAVYESAAQAAAQALSIARDGAVRAMDSGAAVRVRADTICVHGDSPHAVATARAVRRALEEGGCAIAAL